jgi:Protein of unknown function (DUF3617).
MAAAGQTRLECRSNPSSTCESHDQVTVFDLRRLVLALSFSNGLIAAPDLQGVHGLDPGLWKIHTEGTIHVMGFSQPFAKDLSQCVKPGSTYEAALPKAAGKCQHSEHTQAGVMHWKIHCDAGATQVDYDCHITPGSHHYEVNCQMTNRNPPSTTDITAQGRWVQADCGK